MSINEELSFTEYTLTEDTTDFIISFDRIGGSTDEVSILVNNTPIEDLVGYTVLQVNFSTWQVDPALPAGTVVRLVRTTNLDKMVYVFTAGSKFVAKNVDSNFKQIQHSQQEIRDRQGKLESDATALLLEINDVKIIAEQAALDANEALDKVDDILNTGVVPAGMILTNTGQNQQEVNDFGGAKWYAKVGGYDLGATVKLNNGDIVKSTVPNNPNNPNVDRTGWRFDNDIVNSVADLLTIANPKNGIRMGVRSYWSNIMKGGGEFFYDANMPRNKHNGGTIIDPTKAWDGSREQWAYVDGYLPDVGVGVWGVDDESKLTTEVKQAILDRGGNLELGSGLNPTNFRTNQIKLGGFLGASTSTGFGCWVAQTKEISFTMFGAVGDAQEDIDGTDDSFAMLACVRALPKTGAVLNLENYFYTHGNADIRNIVLHFMNFNNLIIKGNLASIQSHSNNLSVTSQAIMRFDYCKDVSVFCLNTNARLDTRMVVGGDPNTHNDQHNVHIGLGCKDITFFKCSANRAIMDGFYIYGWSDSGKDSTQNITFYDCKAHYCYRQGSSHIEGLNIRYIGGSYSYTGTLPNPTGGTKGAAPMSGIDIESNSTDYAARATYVVDGVSFIGNKQKGFIASLNSYGTVSNCEFTDNGYIGLQVEYNAKKIGIFNNKFLGNTNFELYIQATMPIDIAFNLFKSENTTINCVDISTLDSTRSSVDIYRNIFEAPEGVAKGGGCNLDFAGVNFHNNTQLNMDSIWVGGNEKFSYDNNTFETTNADTTKVISTWSGAKFKSVTGNTSILIDGDLIGAGYTLANIDYMARNETNTNPNSVNFEIKKGEIIYNQGTAPAPTTATDITQLTLYVNQMRQEMINQGLWK